MSNLTLPVMSFENIQKIVGTRFMHKVAHNTTVSGYPESAMVYYHNNLIAIVSPDWVKLSSAGWDTTTTATRLNKILKDNCPTTKYRIGIRQGTMSVIDATTNKVVMPFHSVFFGRASGELYTV